MMPFSRFCWIHLSVAGFAFAVLGGLAVVVAQQPRPATPAAQPARTAPAQPARSGNPASVSVQVQGRVTTTAPDRMRRFERPIDRPSYAKPPRHGQGVGSDWHWHPHYGWVWLPVVPSIPFVLPADYALPRTVTYFAAAGVCPCCGRPFPGP